MNRLALLSAAAAGLATALLAACGSTSAAPGAAASSRAAAEAAIPVEVVRPTRGEMRATYSGTATLEAEADAEVLARVGGEVQRVLVEEGDRVRAGQLLAVLDDRQLSLEVAQARAVLAKAEQDYRRQIELHERGLVAAGAFENLRFDLESLRASYELARLQLSYTGIRAPFDGVVAVRHVKRGENLPAGAPAFRITDSSPLKAAVFIPERELRRVAPGQSATLQIDALPGQVFPARVTLVAPTVDAATATFKATIEVADPHVQLRPGMFARIGIVFERRQGALRVPRAALVDAESSPSVFVVRGGKAVQQPVRLGLSDAGLVEVTAGLEGGEQIVVAGQSGLKAGTDVRIVSLAAPAPARG